MPQGKLQRLYQRVNDWDLSGYSVNLYHDASKSGTADDPAHRRITLASAPLGSIFSESPRRLFFVLSFFVHTGRWWARAKRSSPMEFLASVIGALAAGALAKAGEIGGRAAVDGYEGLHA